MEGSATRIVIIEPLGVGEGEFLAIVEEPLGDRVEIVYHNTKTMGIAELIERGKDAEIIVVSNLSLNTQVMEGCRNLKFLVVASAGVDHIVIDMCRENNVVVCDCAGYPTRAVADLMFDMLISLYRNVIPCDKVCREEGIKDGLVGLELEGKMFGVVGTGTIDLCVATIAQAFGCRILAYNRTAKGVSGMRYVDLETLLAESGVVSLYTSLTEKTRGPTNEKHIGLMKKDTVLTSTVRGPVIDSDTLAGALEEGGIADACIDVFENEPPVRRGHPLFLAPSIIVTSHVAFATRGALVKQTIIVFDNVMSYLGGAPWNVIG